MNGSNLPFVSIYARENLSSVTGYEIASVHVALIHYIVTNGSGSDEESSSILTVNNLKITGNTKKYNSEADGSTVAAMNRNSGGYLGIMGSYGVTLNVNNTIIQNTTVAINPNNETSLNVSTTVIKNSFSNAIYAFDNKDIVIRNCHFEDAGGAAIHVEDTESYEKTDGTQTFATKSIVDLDAATEIHNYVSGDEGFFKSRSFEILITGMKAQFQAGAEANGMSMIEKITDPATGLEYEKINLIMLAVPRGDNTREDGPWDIIDGWKNYHSGGIYQGMNYNMQKFSITGADSTVQSAVATAMVEANRAKVVAGVKAYIMSAMSLTDEQATAYLDTAEGKAIVEQEIAKQIQNQISDYNKATTSKDLGTNSRVVPLQYSSNHAFGLGYGYMLTGYSIPTFGNSIIVTGVSGKKLS